MGLSFFKDTVTVLRASVTTKNGAEYRDWSNATQTTINNVLVTARGTSQDFVGRVQSVSDERTLRADYDVDIQQGDRVIFDGSTYEVNGEVFHTKSPTGRVSSTRCALIRWDG